MLTELQDISGILQHQDLKHLFKMFLNIVILRTTKFYFLNRHFQEDLDLVACVNISGKKARFKFLPKRIKKLVIVRQRYKNSKEVIGFYHRGCSSLISLLTETL